jgi:hypothetical protein
VNHERAEIHVPIAGLAVSPSESCAPSRGDPIVDEPDKQRTTGIDAAEPLPLDTLCALDPHELALLATLGC